VEVGPCTFARAITKTHRLKPAPLEPLHDPQ
jgi:hypothetical protein